MYYIKYGMFSSVSCLAFLRNIWGDVLVLPSSLSLQRMPMVAIHTVAF
jgi:hypothetical protein